MPAFRMPQAATAFSVAPSKGQKRPRKEDGAHLKAIRGLPCCVCGTRRNVEAAHIRMANRQLGKAEAGMQKKSDDAWTIPLCDGHHRLLPDAQHNIGEEKFYEMHRINPFLLALALSNASPDDIVMEGIVQGFRRS